MKRTTPSKYRPKGAGFVLSAKKTDDEETKSSLSSPNPVKLGLATPGRSKVASRFSADTGPPKPPRTFEYDQELAKNSPEKDKEVPVDVKALGKNFEVGSGATETPKFGRVRKRIPTGENGDGESRTPLPSKSPHKLNRKPGVQHLRGTLIRNTRARFKSGDNNGAGTKDENDSDSPFDTPTKSGYMRVEKEDVGLLTPKGQASRVVKDLTGTPGRYSRVLKNKTDCDTPSKYGRVPFHKLKSVSNETPASDRVKEAVSEGDNTSDSTKSPVSKRGKYNDESGAEIVNKSDTQKLDDCDSVETKNLAASAFEKFRSIDGCKKDSNFANGDKNVTVRSDDGSRGLSSGLVKLKATNKAEVVVSPAGSDDEQDPDNDLSSAFKKFLAGDRPGPCKKNVSKTPGPSQRLSRVSKFREVENIATPSQLVKNRESRNTALHDAEVNGNSEDKNEGQNSRAYKPRRRISLSTDCGQMTITVSSKVLDDKDKDKIPSAMSRLIENSDTASEEIKTPRTDDKVSLSLDKDSMVTLSSPANLKSDSSKEVITKISPNLFDDQKVSPSSLGQVKRKASPEDAGSSQPRGTPRRRERKEESKDMYDDDRIAALKAKYGRRRNKTDESVAKETSSPPPRPRARRVREEYTGTKTCSDPVEVVTVKTPSPELTKPGDGKYGKNVPESLNKSSDSSDTSHMSVSPVRVLVNDKPVENVGETPGKESENVDSPEQQSNDVSMESAPTSSPPKLNIPDSPIPSSHRRRRSPKVSPVKDNSKSSSPNSEIRNASPAKEVTSPETDSPSRSDSPDRDSGRRYLDVDGVIISPSSGRPRYHTQPVETSNEEKAHSPARRARSFGDRGRTVTQPVTSNEKKSANDDINTPSLKKSPGGSIADRLASLQKSGEEDWRKRVGKSPSTSRESTPDKPVVMRDKSRLAGKERPSSIADRLTCLQDAQKGWKDKVGEKDVKRFTVAGRLDITGKSQGQVDSPLSNRQRRTPKMPLTRESESSDGGSNPTSPIKTPLGIKLPGLGFPLTPKTPTPEQEQAPGTPAPSTDSSKENTPLNTPLSTPNLAVSDSDEEKEKPTKVEVPRADDETFTKFFETTNNKSNQEKVDVTVDDFNHVFIEANDILPSMKKLKPQRRQAGSRNPLRKLQARDDIQLEYTEVKTDVAEKELRRIKREQIAGTAHFASDALAGLASKENFSKIKLKKSDSSSGGAAPGEQNKPFRDVMLLHVKGRRHCQTRLVEPSAKSINSGDCFVLVTKDKVFVWIGEFSNVIEKAKAAELGSIIAQKKDMGCKAAGEPIIINERKGSSGGSKFWNVIGGQEDYRGPGTNEEDEEYEAFMAESTMVFGLVGDELVPVEEYWGTVLKHEMLQPKMVYVFDFGGEMYIWTGKQVPFEKRKKAVKLAREMWEKGFDYSECDLNPITPLLTEEQGGLPLKSSSRPNWGIFGKVNQNMETQLFKEKFIDWPDSSRLIKVKGTEGDSDAKAELNLNPYDASLMVPLDERPVSLVLEGSNLGRGNHWKENHEGLKREFEILKLGLDVWHVLEYEHFKLEEASLGQFHDGDTYVIRWHYMISQTGLKGIRGQAARSSTTGRERCAYFFWQGKNSSITEQGASALMTVELDEERGPQVRVEQGKEPPAFTNLFNGAMITYIGKREEEETNTKGPWKFFVVGNELTNETCLTEVSCGIEQLRSRGSFVLMNIKTGVLYVWQGVKSPIEKRTAALEAAQTIQQNRPMEMCLHKDAIVTITQVEEGEENREFFAALGSKDRSLYHTLLEDKKRYTYSPRLFYMSSVSGVFEAKEVLNPTRSPDHCSPLPFQQIDLYNASQPALFLLDDEREVYLWQGWWPETTEETDNVKTGSAEARFNVDRRCALETVLHYCREKNPDKPPRSTVVFAGVEPLKFTNLFSYWERDPTVRAISKAEGRYDGQTITVDDMLEKLSRARYTFAELQERPLPEGVDPLKLESYLPDDEFEEIIGMTREEFYAMPAWKQVNTKKDIPGLF